jgi:hypothetical protein
MVGYVKQQNKDEKLSNAHFFSTPRQRYHPPRHLEN